MLKLEFQTIFGGPKTIIFLLIFVISYRCRNLSFFASLAETGGALDLANRP